MSNSEEACLSYYLSSDENYVLSTLLQEHYCKNRASAIVEVFGTDPPRHDSWTKLCAGVAVFVADSSRRSFYIQVYDPIVFEKLFEQELYKEFVYVTESYVFHQFEGDNQIIGLHFAFEEEASVFNDKVNALLDKRKLKAAKVQGYNDKENRNQINENESNLLPSVEMRVTPSHHIKNKRKKIRKSEIGNPENFVHISHVGYNSDTSSPANSQEAILATILELSNIKPRELEDENTKQVFLTFIESNGGLEKVYKKLKAKSSSGFSNFSNASFFKKRNPTISRPKAPLPDLPEGDVSIPQEHSPAIDSSSSQPAAGFAGWNRLVQNEKTSSSIMGGSKEEALPPQPPPREMFRSPSLPLGKKSAVPPPPPPPQQITEVPGPTLRPAMMRSASLPHHDTDTAGNRGMASEEPQEDSRDDLLNQIRNPGFKLKKVDQAASEKATPSRSENSLIASLAQTLGDRNRAIQGISSDEESESDEGSEDTDEWD